MQTEHSQNQNLRNDIEYSYLASDIMSKVLVIGDSDYKLALDAKTVEQKKKKNVFKEHFRLTYLMNLLQTILFLYTKNQTWFWMGI